MSGIVVQKYGGSSVADADKIKLVAARIAATRQAGKQVVVVVSAMGTTTNQLVARAREISPAPPRRELDMLLTCGERASMALLSMAVSELGYEAISFTGSQSGIMTNDRHSGARIIEVRPIRVQDELERGRVVIVAGFQGVSYKREITTLGRGGSDTTAVALAAALGAEYCEICSDVDGVYTADPRLVSAARLLEAISYDEMLELATHGARVLHPEAVEFARRSGIALYARATAAGGAGTRIDAVGSPVCQQAAGVAGHKNLVQVSAPNLEAATGLLALAAAETLPVFHYDSDRLGGTAELWLAIDDVPDWTAVRERMVAAGLAIAERVGAASLVGDRIGTSATTLVAVRELVEQAGISVRGIDGSPMRVTVFCAEAEVDALVEALHRRFCARAAPVTG